MSRLHPFDVLAAALPEEWFREIRTALGQGPDATDRLRFHDLGAVRRVLQELAPAAREASGTTSAEYETLLYAVYRFWLAGRHSLVLGRPELERALALHDGGQTGGGTTGPLTVPHGACYLGLPERLFWARIDEATAPEPLDGMFVAAGAGDQEITVLAVLGLRPERGGFSQIAITAPPADFARAGSFARRPLFAPVLEGGVQAGVKSLVSEAELLHLAHLALAEVAR